MKAVTVRRIFLFKLNTSLYDLKLFKLSLPGVNCQKLLIYRIFRRIRRPLDKARYKIRAKFYKFIIYIYIYI